MFYRKKVRLYHSMKTAVTLQKHPQALGRNKAMIYTGRFLTTIFNFVAQKIDTCNMASADDL